MKKSLTTFLVLILAIFANAQYKSFAEAYEPMNADAITKYKSGLVMSDDEKSRLITQLKREIYSRKILRSSYFGNAYSSAKTIDEKIKILTEIIQYQNNTKR